MAFALRDTQDHAALGALEKAKQIFLLPPAFELLPAFCNRGDQREKLLIFPLPPNNVFAKNPKITDQQTNQRQHPHKIASQTVDKHR